MGEISSLQGEHHLIPLPKEVLSLEQIHERRLAEVLELEQEITKLIEDSIRNRLRH